MFKSNERKPFLDDKELVQVTNHGALIYPHRLNFYDRPPLYDVTVEEFETCALDRLRILAEIESSAARNRSWEELKTVTNTQCLKYLPLHATSAKTVDRDSERRKDHLGHFVLRLAFCRSEDLRRRFIKAESTLFKIRYEADGVAEREMFLSTRDFNWIAVDAAEKAKYRKELLATYQGSKIENVREQAFEAEKYYKVRWTRVPDLVEKRRVFLRGGWAYVPGKEQSSIVFQEFEVYLARALEVTARAVPRLDEDSRLVPILDNLSQGFLAGVPSEWMGSGENATGDDIKAEMVDELAKKHFPMCMRTMHSNLRKDHHLKHFGRLNYGLFLKVLGLSIEEAIVFWRKSFDRMTDDKFNKEYKYNIRHSYGLEGKRANYAAKSCQQLLTAGPSEHGCPYRHYSPENLQTALLSTYSSHGLTSDHLPEIMATVKGNHFHVACTRVFEITHSSYGVKKGDGVGDGESVTHPNQYAARSMELYKAQQDNAEAMVVE
ncbi:eukaryotic and archaeal DNA primase, large subunit-domain-containing protein [Lyophyllum atratum]|nr:eukaryotic and archaeal DNA primase, large subunit-domain-containing protein [Lyophyllum atratum]